MKIVTLPCGDQVHRFDRNIFIPFSGKRKVLSTAPLNGGYREDLTGALNHDGNYGRGCSVPMKADTYKEHMRMTLCEIGLPEKTTAGLETAAQMENVSIITESFRDLSVTAITTGGIEASGGRVGDPADWYEEGLSAGKSEKDKGDCPDESSYDSGKRNRPLRPGTINIILSVNANLYEGTMVRALVTAVEAKTAALQELLAPSCYSSGLATGSGTDGIILIANAESSLFLTDAGKFSKLGELIGKAVKASVKEALNKQNGLSGRSQYQIMKRMGRFGMDEASLYRRMLLEYPALTMESMPRWLFSERLEKLELSGLMVGYTSMIAHALDQMNWGLLAAEETEEVVRGILSLMGYEENAAMEDVSYTVAEGEGRTANISSVTQKIIAAFERMLLKKMIDI